MLHKMLCCSALLVSTLAADTVTLRSGESLQGDYLGGDARRVRMAVGDNVRTFNIEDVSEIRFGPAASASKVKPATPVKAGSTTVASPAKPAADPKQRIEVMRPSTVSEAANTSPTSSARGPRITRVGTEIPAGTTLVVRMIDDVDSARDQVGQTFRASVDEPVLIDGETVIPKGADVVAKLVADKEAGKLTGRAELTLDLASIQMNGRMVDVVSQEVTMQSENRTDRTTKVVGGVAALGAIIGAVAGGGRGAAAGAVAGAATGGAIQVLTKGPTVKIPSETRLSFTLREALKPSGR